MIVNVKFHSCLNQTPLTFTLPPSLKLRPSLNPFIEKSVLKTMDQDWVTFYFLSGSHLWLILTSVFVIKQSAQRPCWPVPSLLLIFPPKLFFLPNVCSRQPSSTLRRPPDSHSAGCAEDVCELSPLWSRQSDRMLYTSKEEGGVALSSTLPVWTGWDSSETRDGHIPFQFLMEVCHTEPAEEWRHIVCPSLCLTASILVELLSVAHFVQDTSSEPDSNWRFISIALRQISCWCYISSNRWANGWPFCVTLKEETRSKQRPDLDIHRNNPSDGAGGDYRCNSWNTLKDGNH